MSVDYRKLNEKTIKDNFSIPRALRNARKTYYDGMAVFLNAQIYILGNIRVARRQQKLSEDN